MPKKGGGVGCTVGGCGGRDQRIGVLRDGLRVQHSPQQTSTTERIGCLFQQLGAPMGLRDGEVSCVVGESLLQRAVHEDSVSHCLQKRRRKRRKRHYTS